MSEAPEGLRYLPGFLSKEEERMLVDGLSGLAFREIHMHGVVARRTVVHYGWDYGYESWHLTSAPPLPRFLEPMRARCAEAAGLESGALEELLVSCYPPARELAPRSAYILA